LRGRKGKAKEGKGPFPCLGVKKPTRKGKGGLMRYFYYFTFFIFLKSIIII